MNLYIAPQGRLGNNLFQYFFGYILAKKINCNFYTLFNLNIPFLPNREKYIFDFDLRVIEEYRPNKIQININNKYIDKNLEDIAFEIQKHGGENIFISGFFQDINYFLPHLDEITSFFKNSKQYIKIKKQIDLLGTGICIRKTDIAGTKDDLPDEWFLKNAEKFADTRLYITTDDKNHPLCQQIIQKYKPKVIEASPINIIIAFSFFKNLVLSQGTFSWWAGILNENSVYSMLPKTGWNSNDAFINLKTPWWNWLKLEEV